MRDIMQTQTLTATLMTAALVIAGPAFAQGYTAAAPDELRLQELAARVASLASAHPDFLQGGVDAAQRARDAAERARENAERDRDNAQRDRDREAQYYDSGQSALDSSRWDRAVGAFDRVIDLKGTKADAALYWKAYAQNKLGQRPEALATINALAKEYPKSRYLSDAKALEVEVRGASGAVNPATEDDEDLTLLALQSLANNAPEEAVPMIQK